MDYLGIDLSCATGSLRNGEFPAKDCLLPLITKLLGYFLVAASMTVKLPQIMKIVDNKSVRGLSIAAFELEVPLSVTTWVRAILYFALAPTVFAGQIDPLVFEALYASKHLIFLSARIPQIWKNFRNKSTGQLSFLTCLMNLGGSMARVFTSIQVNAPFTMLLGILLAVFTNGIIMSQILLYRTKEKEETLVKDKKIS
ncbi:mannose-P-dolichol utilization defect 1 protein homolog 1 isoform X2 [Eutrema salsugineum]|uniref:mannose-P-dolichol utilization defect 1 protein homolog 1 isoform X2 n=1 Tax=Eutrema salsugineum TaxID=72664 RepID=UPI000CED2AE6|nr:mannose-P-dolichol utilization defect 1 protein homolog 1 isoform X2 [Eutrema salsugineum]